MSPISPTSNPSPSAEAEAEALANFTNFPWLPIEMRRKIWSFALPRPHVVEFEWHGRSRSWYAELLIICSKSVQRSPVLFRVNQEARGELVHHYQVIHPQTWAKLYISDGFFPDCYFNLLVDTLYLTPRARNWESAGLVSNLRALDLTVFHDLRFIAIQFDEFLTLTGHLDREPPWHDQRLSLRWELRFIQERFHTLIRGALQYVELSVVVGDFSHKALREDIQAKTKGIVELASLGPSMVQPYISSRRTENLRSWLSYLTSHLPREFEPVMSIKQALRGGELVKIRGIGLFTEWKIFQWEDPHGYEIARARWPLVNPL